MRVLLAPNDFRMPMVRVRSNIRMSSPLMVVKPATPITSAMITSTLRSSRFSHCMIEAVDGFSLRDIVSYSPP